MSFIDDLKAAENSYRARVATNAQPHQPANDDSFLARLELAAEKGRTAYQANQFEKFHDTGNLDEVLEEQIANADNPRAGIEAFNQKLNIENPYYTPPQNPEGLTNLQTLEKAVEPVHDAYARVFTIPTELAKTAAGMVRLATGDKFDLPKKIYGGIENVEGEFENNILSEEAKQQAKNVSDYLNDDTRGLSELPRVAMENPREAIGTAIKSLGSMLVPAAGGAGALRVANALKGALSKAATEKILTAGVAGTNALMNAADTFNETEEVSLPDRYKGAGVSGAMSLLANALTGGAADKTLAKVLTGGAGRKSGVPLPRGMAIGGLKDAGKEGIEETIEEGGNALGEQVARKEEINPLRTSKRGAYGGIIGAGTGGAVGSLSNIKTNNTSSSRVRQALAQALQRGDITPEQGVDVAELISQLGSNTLQPRYTASENKAHPTQPAQSPQPETPPVLPSGQGAAAQLPPPVEESPAAATATPPSLPPPESATPAGSTPNTPPKLPPSVNAEAGAKKAEDTSTSPAATPPALTQTPPAATQEQGFNPPSASDAKGGFVLQNRNRSTKASIAQMHNMANHLDFGRTSFSRKLADGAPVVAYGQVPDAQLGRKDYAVDEQGQRIPVQYAVIEADDVLTSNDIDGNVIPNYGAFDRVNAIAGNGRITAMQHAYKIGTASKYRSEFEADDMHGLDPAVIKSMKHPILVRVMPNDQVTSDIGDRTNTVSNLQMNPIETAQNDSNRVDLTTIKFNQDGSPSAESVAEFVKRLPEQERAQLISPSGQPTIQAIDRLNNAIFQKAYKTDRLTELYAMSVRPEGKRLINILARLAPYAIKLEGAGDLDIRPLIVDAVSEILEGIKAGQQIEDLARQTNAFSDPDVMEFKKLFAIDQRGIEKPLAILQSAIEFAATAAKDSDEGNMFGYERPGRADIMHKYEEEMEATYGEKYTGFTKTHEDSKGPVSTQENASGRDAGRDQGQNDTGRSSDDQGNGQPQEAEVKAEADNSPWENPRKAPNVSSDDTISEEDVLSRQEGFKFSKSSGWHEDSELTNGVKELFGTTYDPHETGYMMQDGDMLDMTGAHEVDPSDKETRRYMRGQRTVDHREVAGENYSGFSTEDLFANEGLKDRSEYMYNFMARTGAMRMDYDSSIGALSRQPTKAQVQMLAQMGDDNGFLVLSYYTPEGRIVDETELDGRITQRKIKEFFEQAEEKADSGVAGAYASKNRAEGKEKETVQAARTEISSMVGESTVKALEESGRVEVVGSLEDLPTKISEKMNFSRASNVDHQQRYENAIKKLQAALKNRTSAHRVAFNDSLNGWIDIDWGKLGEILDEIQFKTKGAMGLSHIIEKRSIKDQLSPEEIAGVLRKLVRTLIDGEVSFQNNRATLTYKNFRVGVTRLSGSNNYVLTAYGSFPKKAEAGSSSLLDPAGQPPATSLPQRNLSPRDRNRNLSAIADIIVRENLLIKYSKDGTVQGIYDPATGKSYIIAGNIKKGEARGVFMHEIGIHMAADKEFRQTMKPIIKRAQQIVNVGFRNGDPTAIEAHKRLIDAGEQESNAEEACAYLTEVAANSKKLSGPIRQWFRRLKAAINAWLIRHNFRDVNKLSAQDIVDIAMSNVRAMAKESVKAANPQYQQPSLAVKFSVNKEAGPGGSHSRNTSWGLGPIWTKDEFGDYKFNWGEKLYDGGAAIMKRTFDLIDNLANNKFQLGMMGKELRQQMRQFKADKDNIMRELEPIVKEMSTWKDWERVQVSDIIEKCLASNVVPSEKVMKVALAMQDLFNRQTDELVALGGISKEAADRWRGQYLPRIYNRAQKEFQQSVFDEFFGRKKPIASITGNHLKGRGNFQIATSEKEVAQYVQMGFEVRDQNWEFENGKLKYVGSDPRVETLFGKDPEQVISEGVTVWKDYTFEERALMGEVRDSLTRFVLGYMATQRDLAVMRLYNNLSSDSRFSRGSPADGYVFVPKIDIEGAPGVKKYGNLSGRYVTQEVFAQLQNVTRETNAFLKAYRKMLSAWKEGKTVLNPVAHFNNTVGNLTMAHFAGVSYWDLGAYAETVNEFIKGEKNSPLIQEAYKYGLFSGSFTKEEMAKLIPDPTLRSLLKSSESGLDKTIDFVNGFLSWGLRSKLRSAYEFEDAFFKLLLYKHARYDAMMSPEDAVDYANTYIFTYDDLPSGAAKIRDYGIPFFAWTYKAIPCLLKTAMVHPGRFLAPAAILSSLKMATYFLLAGGGDDDNLLKRWDRAQKLQDYEEKTMPEYMKGMTAFFTPKSVRIWNDSLTGEAQFLDISRWIPGGDMFDADNQMGGIDIFQPIMPSHPLIGIALAMVANKDSFTGKEVVNELGDTDSEKFQKRAEWLAKNLSPSLAPWSYHGTRLAQAISYETGYGFLKDTPGAKTTHEVLTNWFGKNGFTGNHVPMELSRALEHSVGIKNRLVDFEYQEQMAGVKARVEINAIKQQYRAKARAAARQGLPMSQLEDARKDAYERIQRIMKEEQERRKGIEASKQQLNK